MKLLKKITLTQDIGKHGESDNRDFFFCVIVPVLIFGTVFLFVNWNFFSGPLMEMGDDASYALQILDAKSFKTQLGPYSKFGFHHPGPILFYYYAFMEPSLWFIPTPMGKHCFAQFLLNLFFLFFSLQIFYKLYQKKRLVYLFFLCLLIGLLPISPQVYSSLWPPHVLVIPMILFFLASIGVACGQSRYFPETAVSATVILHSNLSGAVVVIPILIISSVLYLIRRKKDPLPKHHKNIFLLLTLLFLLISFAPPTIEEFQPGEGNVTKIFKFFQNRETDSHSFKKVANFVLRYYYNPIVKMINPQSSAKANPLAKTIVLLLFLVLVINLFYRFNRVPKSTRYFCLFLLVSLIFSFYGATRVPGILFDHIFFYQFGLAVMFYFVLLSGLLDYLPSFKIKNLILVIMMGCIILAISLRYYKSIPNTNNISLINKLIDTIQPQKEFTYELFINKSGKHRNQWVVAVGLALKLRRMGYRFCVSKDWQLIFGKPSCESKKTNIRRISFYLPKHSRTQVREKTASFRKTMIQWGGFKKLSLPVQISFNGPDEYFQQWHASSSIGRAFPGKKASIIIPIDTPDKTVKTCRLEIEGHGVERGRALKLFINGHFLSEIFFSHTELKKKFVDFDAVVLRTQGPTLLELHCENIDETEQKDKNSFVFVFKSLQISAL